MHALDLGPRLIDTSVWIRADRKGIFHPIDQATVKVLGEGIGEVEFQFK